MWVPVSPGEQLIRQFTWVVRLGYSKATVYCKVALATLYCIHVYVCELAYECGYIAFVSAYSVMAPMKVSLP